MEGRKISRTQIRFADRHVGEVTLLSNCISSLPGTTYRERSVHKDVRELYASGLVDDVHFTAKPDGDAVKLLAEVTPRSRMTIGGFAGNIAFSDVRLARQIKLSDPITEASLEAACHDVENYYRSFGYKDAHVRTRHVSNYETEFDSLVFIVDEGLSSP